MDETIASSHCELIVPEEERKTKEEIEKSITGKFKKTIWSKFTRAIKEFSLVEEGDKIAVGVSGGKDSLLMAMLFRELKKHRKVNFTYELISMDPGYHPSIRELFNENNDILGLEVKVFDSNVFHVVNDIAKDYPCYMCARMRRGHLYSKARELGCNKLALGHHYNDAIETIMLNLIYGGTFKAMPPKLRSSNYREIELIRPLYYVEEENIRKWRDYSGLMPLNCACMVSAKKTGNKRYEIKDLIESMKSLNKDIEKTILKASSNVYLDTILGSVSKGEKREFNDLYEERLKNDVWSSYSSGKVENRDKPLTLKGDDDDDDDEL